MEDRYARSTKNARSKIRDARRDIQYATVKLQRGRADLSAEHFANGFKSLMEATEDLADIIDRLNEQQAK